MTTPLLVSVVLAILAAPAAAQGILQTWPIVAGGASVCAAGDLDGDGVEDYALGVTGGHSLAIGRLTVVSGRTGATLLLVESTTPGDGFGKFVEGLGDVDGDGRPDVAVGAVSLSSSTAQNSVSVRSGSTGVEVWRFAPTDRSVGHALARVPDRDLDGVDELLVGAHGIGSTPSAIFVLSGATGSTLLTFTAPPGVVGGFGWVVQVADDHDGDGVRDYAITAPTSWFPNGHVSIHSGATGAPLLVIPTHAYGTPDDDLAPLGDVNGDGVPDLAVSTPFEPIGQTQSQGRVRVLSGADGSLLWSTEPTVLMARFGESIERMPDIDGDGRDELLVGAGSYRVGCCTLLRAEVRIYSGATGALIEQGVDQSSRGIRAVRDVNGDGYGEYLLPRGPDLTTLVAALALSRNPPPAVEAGCVAKTTSQGCVPRIAAQGAPSATMGPDLAFSVSLVRPLAPGLFAWSTIAAQAPFAGGMLCLGAPIRRWPMRTTSAAQADPACAGASVGTLAMTLSKSDIAAIGLPPASTIQVQAWFRDAGFAPPNDVGLSGALRVTLWP